MKLFGIFAAIIGLVGLVFLVSLLFPKTYRIERSTVINKPVYETYAYMNSIRNWADWSPWNNNLDSSMVSFYSKVKSGVGSTQYFRGGLVGVGRFKINKCTQNAMIHYDLCINEGTMHSEATFYFKPIANKTQLIWVDSGDVGYNPIFRFMLPSKIKSTEAGFEEGLYQIKHTAENTDLP